MKLDLSEVIPCTIRVGSDKYAARVVEVLRNQKTLMVVREFQSRAEELRGGREDTRPFTRRRNGRYVEQGQKANGTYLILGIAETKLDPSF